MLCRLIGIQPTGLHVNVSTISVAVSRLCRSVAYGSRVQSSSTSEKCVACLTTGQPEPHLRFRDYLLRMSGVCPLSSWCLPFFGFDYKYQSKMEVVLGFSKHSFVVDIHSRDIWDSMRTLLIPGDSFIPTFCSVTISPGQHRIGTGYSLLLLSMETAWSSGFFFVFYKDRRSFSDSP